MGTALITGASSGIGEAFARRLASLGLDVVLVARRKERLDVIAEDLTKKHAVNVDVMPADLAKDEGISRIEQRIAELESLVMLINVASTSAFIPLNGNAIYSATKSYLIAFSECLHLEVRGAGIKVQALCPGFTRSGFHDTDEYSDMDRSAIPNWLWMSAEETVERSLDALDDGKVVSTA